MANDLFTLGLNVSATKSQMDKQLKQIAKELSDSKAVQVTGGLNLSESQKLLQSQLNTISKNLKVGVEIDTSAIKYQKDAINKEFSSGIKSHGVKIPFQFDLSDANAVKTEINKIVADITKNQGSLIKYKINVDENGQASRALLTYASVLKKPLFDYCLVKYFTDIELFKNPEDFSLNMIDKFLADNKKNVLDIVTKAMSEESYNEMLTACKEAVEFRKAHFSDFRDEVADLLQAIRELVIKPDALSELLSALTNSVNSFADKGDIDMELVNKLANIIPVMEKINTPEIAKAIIELHKNDNTLEDVNEVANDTADTNNVSEENTPNLKVVK